MHCERSNEEPKKNYEKNGFCQKMRKHESKLGFFLVVFPKNSELGQREVQILQKLNEADKFDKKHIIRLLGSFEYRRHFCMVFE